MNRTVVPIPPSYDEKQKLETRSTESYVKFLFQNNIKTIMTTAGTSQFNLLSVKETIDLNKTLIDSFPGNVLVGVPPMSTNLCKEYIQEIEKVNKKNINFLILYPERMYNVDCIKGYFKDLRESSNNPLYIHGNAIRNAPGGLWDYDPNTINSLHDQGIVGGIKEECSNLKYSYNFVNGLTDDIDIIVAGGSIRRYEFLKNAGANSFLAGIGNFFPDLENLYFSGTEEEKRKIINIENDIFSVFMPAGWHACLRYSLKYLNMTCLNDRSPWPQLENELKSKIKKTLDRYKK